MKFPPESLPEKIYYYSSPGFWFVVMIMCIIEIIKWFVCPRAFLAATDIAHDELDLGIKQEFACTCTHQMKSDCPNYCICKKTPKPPVCLCGAGGDTGCRHYPKCHPEVIDRLNKK
jgi:hypothetical protein